MAALATALLCLYLSSFIARCCHCALSAAFSLHGCVLVGAAQFCLCWPPLANAPVLVGRYITWLVSPPRQFCSQGCGGWSMHSWYPAAVPLLSPSIAAIFTKLRHAVHCTSCMSGLTDFVYPFSIKGIPGCCPWACF
jgi:hypothetical protein